MPGRPPSASTSIPESSASASIDVPAAAARAFSKAFSAYEAAPARGSVSDGKSVRSRTRYGMPPSRALSSRALARLAVARTSVRSEQEGLFATRLEGAALEPDQPIDAGGGQGQQIVQPVLGERRVLRCALDLDEGPRARHHHVHVHVGGRVLRVVEVEERVAAYDAHADGRHTIADDRARRARSSAIDRKSKRLNS